MTLVIAGYEHEKSMDFSSWSEETKPYVPTMNVDGLFAIADSAITSHQGGRTLGPWLGIFQPYEGIARWWSTRASPSATVPLSGSMGVWDRCPCISLVPENCDRK